LARRLSARARHRKSVLIVFGDWPGADLELSRTHTTWFGLGDGCGDGHLVARELTITVRGRGTASRPTTHRLTFPAAATSPIPLRRRRATPNLLPDPTGESTSSFGSVVVPRELARGAHRHRRRTGAG
jgi:hypothetical protein